MVYDDMVGFDLVVFDLGGFYGDQVIVVEGYVIVIFGVVGYVVMELFMEFGVFWEKYYLFLVWWCVVGWWWVGWLLFLGWCLLWLWC